ncbi:MAG: hypothetical protein IKX59_08610 [Bacteroidales bacterium]|nr:hypothetical protein [Bacteroidales bacterium]
MGLPKFLILSVMALSSISMKAQCDMEIDYSIRNLPANTHGIVMMRLPDGADTILIDGTIRQSRTTCHLNQLGEYRLTICIDADKLGKDSCSRNFMLTCEEFNVKTRVDVERRCKNLSDWHCKDSIISCLFGIARYSQPSPLVEIEYLRTERGGDGAFAGPYFVVHNHSNDTIYGEWLPGYLWGSFSKWIDGKYEGDHVGQICTTWEDQPPLYPGKVKEAWIASMGRRIVPGKYRFNLHYSTDKGTGSYSLSHESDSFRWWTSLENWHLLTCEFEASYDSPKQ